MPNYALGCPEFRQSRRNLLKVSAFGLAGLAAGAPALASPQASGGSRTRARARAVIYLNQFGGPSHHDTFDMKPDAPDNIRGTFDPIDTSAPGIRICEHLPRMAREMHRVAVLRAVHHRMRNHNSATYYSLTGVAPLLDDIRLRDTLDLYPCYGATMARLRPADHGMPSFVAYPFVLRDGSITPGQHASFLGKQYDPLFFTENPNSPGFRLPELTLPGNLTLERLEDRRSMLRLLDEQTEAVESTAGRGLETFYDRAFGMLASARLRRAFNLGEEPERTRDRYGRTKYGQSCLLARRLVEAGVRCVTVYFAPNIGNSGNGGGWDTHSNNFPDLRTRLLPATDQSVPTLLADLADRGLLDETLVVWMGEFGRTPRIGGNPRFGPDGRDHWPQCYSALLAGGGVKGGMVHGASDRHGAYPANNPVRPDDIAATMFQCLGIDPATEVRDPLGRPLPISAGAPICDVLA
ncbi:MAG: DUF1501 domain-containing protein [Gemmataceae bacterium]|nr:DUF1501 domain-containing protein [Gemmataceae bacterium]